MSFCIRNAFATSRFAAFPLLACLLMFAILGGAPSTALAAQSYDSCTGFIDSVPATITSQGVWCLRKDLTTAIGQGDAITIANNNVTIDCNDFKIGGLAAGTGTFATGIRAANRLNATVRHCNVRGFWYGIVLGGSGHLVESNRLDGNTYFGIRAEGDGTIVRDNLIVDTGGSTNESSGGWATAIDTAGNTDIVGNTIVGMVNVDTRNDVTAIFTKDNNGGTIVGNRVRGLSSESTLAIRVYTGSSRVLVQDNAVQGNNWGIYCDSATVAVAKGNLMIGGGKMTTSCYDAGGNIALP